MCTRFEHLLTTSGTLKVLHVVFGAISLGLIAHNFVPVKEEIILVCTVGVVFLFSLTYLLAYAKWEALATSGINKKIDFVYHIVAGLSLIIVGTYVTSWSDYYETCNYNCPSGYSKSVAKILTFVNGVLYGIVSFLNVKEDDLMKEDELTDSDLEDFALVVTTATRKKQRSLPRTPSRTYQTINA